MDLAGKRLGIALLARPTFDVPFAEEMAKSAVATLEGTGATLIGSRALLFDKEAAEEAISALSAESLDGLVIVQATFTDAAMTVVLAQSVKAPIVLWAFPEERTGGRLRLNSFCGINLAGHALGKAGISYDYLFQDPSGAGVGTALADVLAGHKLQRAANGIVTPDPDGGRRIADALSSAKIGLIGEHPDGFHTCAFDAEQLADLAGLGVSKSDLPSLFSAAKGVDGETVSELHASADAALNGLGSMEAEPLEKALRSFAALEQKAKSEEIQAFAIRCWPEFFTDYGCAACGAMAMLGEGGTPCACEADVCGAASLLMLKAVADDPPFLADLVDVDVADDTVVFWHCGLAPVSLADPAVSPAATIHSNRKKPLLNEFPLKPGRITIARLSQSLGQMRLVIGAGEMLARPNSFGGTSGVARLDQSAQHVMDTIMGEGLEHHYAFAYGDHRGALAGWAERAGVPVLTLA
ncbi:MAG: hypothetical protein AAFW76_10450 [Pseudomonadota bacterium]